jgi:hypothetical protein
MCNPSGSAGLDHGRTTLDGMIADLPPDPVAEGPFLGGVGASPDYHRRRSRAPGEHAPGQHLDCHKALLPA